MALPSILCSLSLLLCGLYPVALTAAPAPRASTAPKMESDVKLAASFAPAIEAPEAECPR